MTATVHRCFNGSAETLGPRQVRVICATEGLARDGAVLVQSQELRKPQIESARDARGDDQGRARLAALDLGEHRRADAAALGEVAQRETGCLAQSFHARTDSRRLDALGGR